MQTLSHSCGRVQASPVTKRNTSKQPPSSLDSTFRLVDDIGPKEARLVAQLCGGEPTRILEIGYGVPTPAFSSALNLGKSVKRDAIIIPVRNAQGQIVALHDQKMQWFTAPAVHVANPARARARFAEIQLCDTTPQADSVALRDNICVIARNGCDDRAVQTAVLSALRASNPNSWHAIKRTQQGQSWELAA